MRRGSPCYFISAGEFSGDLLAAELVRAMRSTMPDLQPFGMTGATMMDAGVESIIDQREFAIMGIRDVLLNIAELRRSEKILLSKIDDYAPKFAILVDFPGLHFRLAEQLRLRGIPTFQYVAPKVWAWGPKRIQNLRRDFSEVLGIFPFEIDFFAKHKVPYTYVGTPHVDRCERIQIDAKDLGFKSGQRFLAILPGSRMSELTLILPRLLSIFDQLKQEIPNLHAILPLADSLDLEQLSTIDTRFEHIEQKIDGVFKCGDITVTRGMSLEVMKIADVAVLASGTATLECALLDTPMVVVYVIDATTYEIAKDAVTISYASLVNIILDRMVVKEFIQEFEDQAVIDELRSLFQNESTRATMRAEFALMREPLKPHAAKSAALRIREWMSRGTVSG